MMKQIGLSYIPKLVVNLGPFLFFDATVAQYLRSSHVLRLLCHTPLKLLTLLCFLILKSQLLPVAPAAQHHQLLFVCKLSSQCTIVDWQ